MSIFLRRPFMATNASVGIRTQSPAYQAYQDGTLRDLTATDEQIAEALARLPGQPDDVPRGR